MIDTPRTFLHDQERKTIQICHDTSSIEYKLKAKITILEPYVWNTQNIAAKHKKGYLAVTLSKLRKPSIEVLWNLLFHYTNSHYKYQWTSRLARRKAGSCLKNYSANSNESMTVYSFFDKGIKNGVKNFASLWVGVTIAD